jgi:superfamily II DNA helicase RecQ
LFDSGGAPTREGYFAGSRAWHQFTGFLLRTEAGPEGKRLEERASLDQEKRLAALANVDVDSTFRVMYGAQASFRGVQKEALNKVITGHRAVAVVMPTGEGKSIVYQLPAFTGLGGTTVVILPLCALQEDLSSRCKRLGISHAIWNAHACWPFNVSLIFITPESFIQGPFQSFLNQCLRQKVLDRIVIDECHEALISFRTAFKKLGDGIDYTIQVVCLTATLEPSDEPRLWQRLGLFESHATTVRQNTAKKNVRYSVTELHRTTGSGKQVADVLRARNDEFYKQYGNGEQILIFCNTKAMVEELAEELSAPA